MKKLLGIVVLGLITIIPVANSAEVLDILYKDENKIHIYADYWFQKDQSIAIDHCKQFNKSTYKVKYSPKLTKYYKKKGVRIKLSYGVSEFICSTNKIVKAPSYSFSPGRKITQEWTNQNSSNSQDINFTISEKKQQCEAIGFTPKTEKFADCVLRLVELDMKNQQSNNMIASQNKSDSDKFMSNALLNLGQQLMQPNSNIYNSNTRNCSVRKSFGNTSTVTCY